MDCSPDNAPFSYFTKAVVLHKWWLVKPRNGEKGLAVAGHASKESQSVRLFSSAPIAKRFDLFTLQTTDGIDIILRGNICKIKSIDNGFPSEIINHFVFGFPPKWKEYTEGPFGVKTDTKFDSKEKENSSTHMLSPSKASKKYWEAIQDKHGDMADMVIKQESSEYSTRAIQEVHDDTPDMMHYRRIVSSESNKKCNGSSSGYEDNVNPSAVHQAVSVADGKQEESVSAATTVASPTSCSSQNPVNDITKSLTAQYGIKMVIKSSPEEEVDTTGPNDMKGRRKDQKKAFSCQDHMNYKTSEQNSKSESVENPVEENSGQRENFEITTSQSKGNEKLKGCLGNKIHEQTITGITLEELVSTALTITSPVLYLSPPSGNDIMKSPTEQAGIKVVKNSLPEEEMNSVDAVSINMKGGRKNQKRAFPCRGQHKKSEQKSKSESLENPYEDNSGQGDISVAITCQSKGKKRLKGCSGHNVCEQKGGGIALELNSDSLTSNHISYLSPEEKAKGCFEISSYKRSRSGRLLAPPLEFWRNQTAVYDADRKITGIKDAFEQSSKGIQGNSKCASTSGRIDRRRAQKGKDGTVKRLSR